MAFLPRILGSAISAVGSGAMIGLLALVLASCQSHQPPKAETDQDMLPGGLTGVTWQLIEFQSMDDATGVIRPDDPSKYTMTLSDDGSVAMVLNCNNAAGSWSAEPAPGSTTNGSFEFGPLAMTRALCPPPSLDERIAADSAYVRSYFLRDGVLALSLMADAGIYLWEPIP